MGIISKRAQRILTMSDADELHQSWSECENGAGIDIPGFCRGGKESRSGSRSPTIPALSFVHDREEMTIVVICSSGYRSCHAAPRQPKGELCDHSR